MLDHPVIPLLVGAALLAVVPRRLGAVVLIAAPAVALVQVVRLDGQASMGWSFFGYDLDPLRLDALSRPFAVAFCVIAVVAGIYGTTIFSRAERVAALASAGFGVAVVLAGDLLTLFVAWELKAVFSAVLIAIGGHPDSGRAAFRYLLFHVVGGSLLLGGILWHLSTGGSLAFEAFDTTGASWAILVAIMLSAAVPPLHPWLPDAYPAASVAGTVVLSAFTTKAAVYALLRGFPGTELLVVAGVAMALYGVVYAVMENDVRRLLSYHIVSQVGFMVAAAGIGTPEAINGATAHAFAHILYKGLLLMAVGALIHATGREKLTELGGLARAMPVLLGLYMVAALSISGAPLLSGFVSKELVVDAAYGDGRQLVVYLLKLASVGTFLSTALKLPWLAWGGSDRSIRPGGLPRTMLVAMGLAAVANVVLGVAPGLLYDLMPYPVDYEPFTLAKLSETLQLLAFTALGFALFAKKLGGEPTITLDTDWLYRRGVGRLAASVQAIGAPHLTPLRPDGGRLPARADLGLLPGISQVLGSRGSGPPPTVALGTVMVVALLVMLAWSLVP
jgi:multicomponent Na+:H+ antiporter subunit D